MDWMARGTDALVLDRVRLAARAALAKDTAHGVNHWTGEGAGGDGPALGTQLH